MITYMSVNNIIMLMFCASERGINNWSLNFRELPKETLELEWFPF
jgi:hypothetical protein